jgi:predicted deacylase
MIQEHSDFGRTDAGTTQRHLIKLPGAALANDEPRPVISVAGAKPGPVLFVNAGVHGGEYPAVEAVIRLGQDARSKKDFRHGDFDAGVESAGISDADAICLSDRQRESEPRVPGDPRGSYSEQMTHALINEFVVHADAYVDLHGGDIRKRSCRL